MNTKSVWIRLAVITGLAGSLAPAGPVFAQATPVVRVDPVATSIAPNQLVTVSIKIDNVSNLGGAEIHLAFNANVLEVIDADQAQAGVQIANGGMLSPDFTAVNVADNTLGTIDFGVNQLNRPGVNGSGTLAIISFKGKAPGTSPVTFRAIQSAPTGVILADASGAQIASSTQSGSVTVSGATPTPTSTPSVTPTGTLTRTVTPTPTPGGGTPGLHVVRAGETLFCIGRAYGVLPWAIATTNRIFSPYRLFPGQVLTIPNVPWTNIPAGPICARQFAGTPPPVPPPPPPPSTCRVLYRVVFGDTLLGIARRYGVNVFTLAARNNIFNLNLIFAGQLLCIP